MKTRLILTLAASTLLLGACKTTEANYKAAYEMAKEKSTDAGDPEITQKLRNELKPKDTKFGEITLPVRKVSVAITKDGGGDYSKLRRFNVVVGQFKQLFNSKSLRDRLKSEGFQDAFLLNDRELNYYIVAASVETPAQAEEVMKKVNDISSLQLKAPYPYVLIPAHMADWIL